MISSETRAVPDGSGDSLVKAAVRYRYIVDRPYIGTRISVDADRDTTTILQVTRTAEELLNERSLNLETFEGVEEATVDLYSAVRNAYLQKRAKMIRE